MDGGREGAAPGNAQLYTDNCIAKGERVVTFFVIPPHAQPHIVFGGLVSFSGRWMAAVYAKEINVADNNRHIPMQHTTTFQCSHPATVFRTPLMEHQSSYLLDTTSWNKHQSSCLLDTTHGTPELLSFGHHSRNTRAPVFWTPLTEHQSSCLLDTTHGTPELLSFGHHSRNTRAPVFWTPVTEYQSSCLLDTTLGTPELLSFWTPLTEHQSSV